MLAQLEDAMLNPTSYDYKPRNNLTQVYWTRWTHSLNLFNSATEFRSFFLQNYVTHFTQTPFYLGEWHKRGGNQEVQIPQLLNLANESTLFYGFSFFQYQRSYHKGDANQGKEQEYGMFGLGDFVWHRMTYHGNTYDISCLVPRKRPGTTPTLPAAVASAFGGPYFDTAELCIPSPDSVTLDSAGYSTISSQLSMPRMEAFVVRIVQHLGAVVVNGSGLRELSQRYVGTPVSLSFQKMVEDIASGSHSWISFDSVPACVADRDAFPLQIANAVDWICSQNLNFSCADIPTVCKGDMFMTGDWVFGHYYNEINIDPLQHCYSGGAAIFSSASLRTDWNPECAQFQLEDQPEDSISLEEVDVSRGFRKFVPKVQQLCLWLVPCVMLLWQQGHVET